MTAAYLAGEPAWIELGTADPVEAEKFYSELFGWDVRQEQLGSGVYRICSIDGYDVAGIVDASLLHGGRPYGWITYLAVDDAPEAIDRAVLGGAEVVVHPRRLPDAGTGAVVVDPFGAVVGFYEGTHRAGVEALNRAGTLCWNELATGDPAGSHGFYRALFDYGVRRDVSPTGRPYSVLTIDDLPVAGVLELESEWPNPIPARWLPYLGVESIDDAVSRVTSLGGSSAVGPVETGHGALQVVRDPEGHALSLIELHEGLRTRSLTPTNAGA